MAKAIFDDIYAWEMSILALFLMWHALFHFWKGVEKLYSVGQSTEL